MKNQKRWLIVAATVLMLSVLLLLPTIIEAARRSGLGTARENVIAKPAPVAKRVVQGNGNVTVGASIHNDTSPPLRDMKQEKVNKKVEREANENPKVPAT